MACYFSRIANLSNCCKRQELTFAEAYRCNKDDTVDENHAIRAVLVTMARYPACTQAALRNRKRHTIPTALKQPCPRLMQLLQSHSRFSRPIPGAPRVRVKWMRRTCSIWRNALDTLLALHFMISTGAINQLRLQYHVMTFVVLMYSSTWQLQVN